MTKALDPELPLPDGVRLVHIGPHKTGTTTLQGAFHLARRAVSEQGVHYAGANRQPLHAAQAVAAVTETTERTAPGLRPWRRLMHDIAAAREPRVLVSSEWFADAQPAGIRLIASDLDPGRMHVAVTLRPLTRILSSQWQQFAQAGHMRAYAPWLQAAFREPEGPVGRPFWHRHRHDRLVARWADVIGTDRVTVVVADDRDRGALLRAFERLTGLRSGTLAAPDDRQNRSLTAAEIELVRQLHMALDREGIEALNRMNLVLFGAAQQLKLRDANRDEARIRTPDWALQEATAIAGEMVERIRSRGVRVVGDLDSLAAAEPPEAAPSGRSVDPDWPALAAAASIGMLRFSGLARDAARSPDMEAIGALSMQRLVGVFSARVHGAIRTRVPALCRAGRRSAGAR